MAASALPKILTPAEARSMLKVVSSLLSTLARMPIPSLQIPQLLAIHGFNGNPSYYLSQAADTLASASSNPAVLNAVCRDAQLPLIPPFP